MTLRLWWKWCVLAWHLVGLMWEVSRVCGRTLIGCGDGANRFHT